MGCNYFLLSNSKYPKINIGKSSVGWHFGLSIYPDLGIYELKDWIKLFAAPECTIQDEEGRIVSPEAMLDVITKRHGYSRWTDQELQENHAERGLNGLAAHKSTLVDLREKKGFERFKPIIITAIRTDGTYDLLVRPIEDVEETY